MLSSRTVHLPGLPSLPSLLAPYLYSGPPLPVAAVLGADDGRVIVWSIDAQATAYGDAVLTLEATPGRVPVACVAWGGSGGGNSKSSDLAVNTAGPRRGRGGGATRVFSVIVAGVDGSVSEFDGLGQCRARVMAAGPVTCICVSRSLVVAAGAGGFLQAWSWPRLRAASAKEVQPKLVVKPETLAKDDVTSVVLDPASCVLLAAFDVTLQVLSLDEHRTPV